MCLTLRQDRLLRAGSIDHTVIEYATEIVYSASHDSHLKTAQGLLEQSLKHSMRIQTKGHYTKCP